MLYHFITTDLTAERNGRPNKTVFAAEFLNALEMQEDLDHWNDGNPYYRYQLLPRSCVKKLFPDISDANWIGHIEQWPL